MTLAALVEICQRFRDLGDMVGEQLADVVEDRSVRSIHDQNRAALARATRDFLAPLERDGRDDDELMEDLAELVAALDLAADSCEGCHKEGHATPGCPECGDDPDQHDEPRQPSEATR